VRRAGVLPGDEDAQDARQPPFGAQFAPARHADRFGDHGLSPSGWGGQIRARAWSWPGVGGGRSAITRAASARSVLARWLVVLRTGGAVCLCAVVVAWWWAGVVAGRCARFPAGLRGGLVRGPMVRACLLRCGPWRLGSHSGLPGGRALCLFHGSKIRAFSRWLLLQNCHHCASLGRTPLACAVMGHTEP
jgi:hypothetical protein